MNDQRFVIDAMHKDTPWGLMVDYFRVIDTETGERVPGTRKFESPTEAQDVIDHGRICIDCNGKGTREWPQSRRDHLGRMIERLAPQIWKCGACQGSGRHPLV